MPDLTPEQQYQRDYDAAAAQLDAAAAGTTGTTTEVTPSPAAAETAQTPAAPAPAPTSTEPPAVETLEELRTRLAKTEKALKDTQAWGTKNSQRLAEIERERQQAQREASRPAILEENPELAEAIKYVTSDPAPAQQAQRQQQDWQSIVAAAHPGIFDTTIDPELEAALVAKRDAMGEAWGDPLAVIREITAEKVAFAERQVGKRFAIEAAKQAEKSAMGVPGASSGAARTVANPDLEAVQRIQNMSDADFAKEVKRVKGY